MKIIRLKVVSLNIHSGINWYGKYDLEGIIQFIQHVSPDLAGFQEVARFWSPLSLFQDLPGELALRLKMFSSYSVSLDRNSRYFGNLVLSKYPITLMWAEQLPGSLEQRSFVFSQVVVEGVRINFITVHLGLSESDRLQQVQALLQITREISGPMIITGDFNADMNDGAMRLLREHFINIQELSGLKQGSLRLRDGKIGSLIDYIFITPEFSLLNYQIVDNYISDHLPVIAELGLTITDQNFNQDLQN